MGKQCDISEIVLITKEFVFLLQKSFMRSSPGFFRIFILFLFSLSEHKRNVIKLLTIVIYEVRNKLFRCSTLGWAPGLARKH